jgi:hypothetical protein
MELVLTERLDFNHRAPGTAWNAHRLCAGT